MERQVKAALVEDLKASVGASPSLVLVDFNGLTVEKSVELRNKCRESQVRFKVVKNTLVRRVVEGTDHQVVEPLLTGMTALAWSEEDAISPAKVIADFVAENEDLLAVKGGALQGNALSAAEVKALAKLPTLPELRAQILGLVNAPASQLLGTINAPAQQVLGTIQAWIDKRNDEAA